MGHFPYTLSIVDMMGGTNERPAGTLGAALLRLRVRAGWSRPELARQAGVSASSIRRWESDQHLPWIPELTAVLRALRASPAEHDKLVALVNRTRVLRTQPTGSGSLGLVGAPRLLRAIRTRAGLSRGEAASRLGVSEAAVHHWETGRAWPTAAHLHHLCFVLGAAPEELEALSAGPVLLRELDPPTLADFETMVAYFGSEGGSDRIDPLLDLRAIAIEDALRFALRSASRPGPLRHTLGFVQSKYAQTLLIWGRDREAEMVAQRVLQEPESVSPLHLAHAGIIGVIARTGRRALTTREAKLHLESLTAGLPEPRRLPSRSLHAWASAALADAFALERRADEALRAMDQAMEHHRSPEGVRWRIKLLVNLNRPLEAESLARGTLAELDASGGADGTVAGVQWQLARALVAAHRQDEARAARDEALEHAHRLRQGYLVHHIHRHASLFLKDTHVKRTLRVQTST